VAIKGHKMARVDARSTMVIDTEAQTMTTVNNENRTYYVTTFEEMRKMLDGAGGGPVGVSDLKVDVKDGDQSKTLLGHETHSKILTITSTITDEKSGAKIDTVIQNELYMARGVEGSEELRNFYKKASGLPWAQGGGPGMNRPEMMKAMSEAYRAAGSMDGLPLMTVMTITGAMPGMPAMPAGADGAGGNPMEGKMAALAAIMAKRRQQQSGAPAAPDQAPNALMQMTIEVTSVSNKPVDPALFEIPAGYTKTDKPAMRGRR
jgi:hypothetical protein